MKDLKSLRAKIRSTRLANEHDNIEALLNDVDISDQQRKEISEEASLIVDRIRQSGKPGLMEVFLAEYGLSTEEGIALMCLAEALLRVPDDETIDQLIDDKITPSSWGQHLGKSSSSLVNASTWALLLTGKILNSDQSEGVTKVLRELVKRLGEPVIRTAVKRAMKELGKQFVLGQTIGDALNRSKQQLDKGYTFSFDMLGEAALTDADALTFLQAYRQAIISLSEHCKSSDIRENPGISIKLSALHPRYEVSQKERVLSELLNRVKSLALLAKQYQIGLNIDAEEQDRLDLSLDLIEALMRDPDLSHWDGLGVVVQAYGQRCPFVIDWLYALSNQLDKKIMVRLVKGAYWDTEIKHAQEQGLAGFPVYTHKALTDISYICCAKKLLDMNDRIFAQFATHNAHTAAAILKLTEDRHQFEFQRLHGMGEELHEDIMTLHNNRCRIYAPVGPHRDLLAYLVRRLLENGANSSFVNQIADTSIPSAEVTEDPFPRLKETATAGSPLIVSPNKLYHPSRENSRGWDLSDEIDLSDISDKRDTFKKATWVSTPLIAGNFEGGIEEEILNPANPHDVVGKVIFANKDDTETAIASAKSWEEVPPKKRAAILRKASDLYESNFGEFFAILCREAGKTPKDSIAELREAVDFLRFYACEAERIDSNEPCGVIGCISPWNFPLAIFTGQIAAALATGNAVIAKPAAPTPIVASVAVKLLHEAGVPLSALQLLPGQGSVVGRKLTEDKRINGFCFTGSTDTAQMINRSMAEKLSPSAPLIAETGGLNTMIVDSTALPEQAVRDIVTSAFQSSGQRCSALRILCIQEDVADALLAMLYGAMDELSIGDPWEFSTDIGPIINSPAQQDIQHYIDEARDQARILKEVCAPEHGNFVSPTIISIDHLSDVKREIFGPVLHVLTFKLSELDSLLDDINASGFGLTFGLHTRIDSRVQAITDKLKVGNMYINRNQIGAIVGSQPFGGEGLSGTGPKAGGPNYIKRFLKYDEVGNASTTGKKISLVDCQNTIDNLPKVKNTPLRTLDLPGPTGESNRLRLYAKGVILCLGPTLEDASKQAAIARKLHCIALIITPGATGKNSIDGYLDRAMLTLLSGFDAVALWSEETDLRAAKLALAQRNGSLIPLLTNANMQDQCILERHVCIDTTAAGGNASLLAASSQ